MEITRWLESLGLEQYGHAFREGDVDAEVLPELTADDLIALGVTSIGHRRKLLAAIAALRPTTQLAAETTAAGATTFSHAHPPVADAERRQVTVMFCDLVGSTALSFQLDPEDLRELIGAYHSCVAQTIVRYDGFVAKYMGEGVLVYFGYPQAHEDDAERAVRAGLALIDAAAEITTANCKLSVRIGIGTGIVVVGDLIGERSAQEKGVFGDTPNLAARLQALAGSNMVLIGPRTRQLLGDLFEYRDLGPVELKGITEPGRAYQVLHQSAIESRFEALRSAQSTPLVGREPEIQLLLGRWQRAKSGSGQVVLLSAEPGIGKSRIASALLDKIQTEPHTCLRYFCSPYHQDSALYPFTVQLERAAGFARDDTAAQKLGKLQRLLAPGAQGESEIMLLAELLSLPNSSAEFNISPRRKRQRLFEALLHQYEAVAQDRPVLLVFEDVHWIDPTSRELLDLTLDRVSQLPVLVIITFRPEFDHAWNGQPHITTLALDRLGESDAAALVEHVAGEVSLTREIVDEIVERADGVPLFVEELTKAVLESCSGCNRVAAVLTTNPLPNLAIPPTLQASLLARLDRLGPIAKEVAQIGAVIGREFSNTLIRQVAGRRDAALQAALDRLTQSGLVSYRETEPASSYLFKHSLVRDTAYGTLLRGRRRELHAGVAVAIVERFSQLAQSEPELVAHQLYGGAR
jgi:class 3 adenylate cyclase